ncbi:sulfotransferase family protein [Alteriqipengyuania sp. 357]
MSIYPGRYVFVAGLHRTGTSLLARLLGDHSRIAAIENAPVPENEGCYLQGAIPHTALHGRPGHFATDPAQHLIEGCAFDTLETKQRIESDWARWFGAGSPRRVEKSPVNLTRMRLYQQLFPTCQFVIILRHPAAMAAALRKWMADDASELIDYGLDAYDIVAQDLLYLHSALVIRYEDLVARDLRPALFGFLGLDPGVPTAVALRDGNTDYDDLPRMRQGQINRASQWGYGADGAALPFEPIVRHPLRAIREATIGALAQ